ncbi:hypothetical protein HYV89_00905 [Candidatus Woesearchaeota archaeon]|nr:hypothetical protein [Candidatus Woesearchaeota archaeon]
MTFQSMLGLVKSSLSIEEAIRVAKPLVVFVIGMVIYSIFIFKFYKFIAKRDIFKLNLAEYSRSRWEDMKEGIVFLFYILEHIIIFPLLTFIWFIFFSMLLIFMSENQSTSVLFLFSMAIVATTRIASYYSEELAREIAKTLPLTLLGIFLVVGLSYFSLESALLAVKSIPLMWKTIVYYLFFIVLLEIALRILLFIYNNIKYKKFEEQ